MVTDDPSNLIELTIEEHANAHKILWEKYGRIEDKFAWLGLTGQIGKDEILAGRLYKIKNFVQPAFYQKVRMMINNGDLEKAEEFISRMEPVSAKKDTEFAAMKGELDSLEEVKDKIAKKLKEGLPKGFFKKELGIGGKKKVKEGSYPFDKCLKDQTAKYGEEGAKKICGAIKAAYGE